MNINFNTKMSSDNKLVMSWYDSAKIPTLNQQNVMDYFSQKSNPFYDRTCNNEVIKMQRADPAQLVNMTGNEYSLLLVQEPILYVIRKLHRQSPEKVIPLADYYVLGGVVYQCPDLQSIINSRLLSTLHYTHQAFEEAQSYARYDPSCGYYWKFPGDSEEGKLSATSRSRRPKDEPTDNQRKRVDGLLVDLIKHFPPKVVQPKEGARPIGVGGASIRGIPQDKDIPTSSSGVKRLGPISSDDNKPPDTKRKKPVPV